MNNLINKLCSLSKIELSVSEKRNMAKDMKKIILLMDNVKNFDSEYSEEESNSQETIISTSHDEAQVSERSQEIGANVFYVPKII